MKVISFFQQNGLKSRAPFPLFYKEKQKDIVKQFSPIAWGHRPTGKVGLFI